MLEIFMFGQLRLLADGVPLKLGTPPKTVPLWAYLLLHPGPVSRNTLAALLWPDDAEAEARANLRRHIYHLQRALPAAPAHPWLLVEADTIGWNPAADYRLDVAEFDRLGREPQTAAQAVDLYAGDLLTNSYDDLLIYERERLRERYLALLLDLLSRARQERAYSAATGYAQRLLAADPLREDALRQLLATRYEGGDRAGALSEYERFARLLRDELGVEPMPETAAIYDAIRRNARLPGSLEPPEGAAPGGSAGLLRQALPFAGREREMEQLRGAWRMAVSGRGAIALIGGEAGVGKSRLAAELALRADMEGGRVLAGGASLAETTPYQVVAQALREALPLVGALAVQPLWLSALLPLLPALQARRRDLRPLPPLDLNQERTRLHEALFRVLVGLAQPRPVLLILEDLHWSGAATVDFLSFLARRLDDQRLLVVGTYREEEVGRDHPLRALRRQVSQERSGIQIALGRLPPSAVPAILAPFVPPEQDAGALAARLYQGSEGNPLFLGELLRDWLEAPRDLAPAAEASPALPSGVREVIGGRIARLSAQAQAVAELAAVAGAAFDVEVVREAGGWSDEQALDGVGELLDRQLVREAGARGDFDYAFAHHLIQETIYAAIRPATLRRRHRRVGQVLAELFPKRRGDLAPQLAFHFDRGGASRQAVTYYLLAAEGALRVYGDAEALAHLSRALELAEGDEEWALLSLREQIYSRQGSRAAQQIDLARLEALAESAGDAGRAAESLYRRAMLHRALGDRAAEGAAIDRLSALSAAGGLVDWRARALLTAAEHELLMNRYEEAGRLGQAALERFRSLDRPESQAAALALLAEVAAHQGRLDEVQGLLDQALAIAEGLGMPALVLQALGTATTAAIVRQEYKLGAALSRRTLELARTVGDRDAEATAHARLATHLMRLFQMAEAGEHYNQAAALFRATGNRRGQAMVLVNYGSFLSRLGHYAQSLATSREAEAAFADLSDLRGQAISLANAGQMSSYIGDFEAAKVAGLRALDLGRQIGNPSIEANVLANIGEAESNLGDLAAGSSHMEEGIALRRTLLGQRTDLARDLCELALTYLKMRRLADAHSAIAESLSILAELPEQIETPQYLLWAAACAARAAGNTAAANDLLAQAFAHLQEKADAIPDPQSRSAFLAAPYHRPMLAAYEQSAWPNWAD